MDESPEEIDYPEPADARAANDLALDLGGIAAKWQTIEITVQGPDDEAIVLNDLRVRVVEDASPLAGVLFTEDVGGSTILRPFSATIEQGTVTADAQVVEDDPSAEGVAPEFPYVVSALDPEVFSLYVTAVECNCTWVAELEWTSDGERDVTVIDDEGTPFRMSSVESVQATYDVGSGDLY